MVQIVAVLLVGCQTAMLKKNELQNKTQCYCGNHLKSTNSDDFVGCLGCNTLNVFHKKCVNMIECEDDDSWTCAACVVDPDLCVERLESFYTQY